MTTEEANLSNATAHDQEPTWKVYPLLGTMWKTKNSRFHAASRLQVRGWWKGIALSVLSAYVLVLSVVPKFIEGIEGSAHRDYVGLIALTASIFILVFSVTSIFDEDKLRSNYMHDNAREIGRLYHAYKLTIDAAYRDGHGLPASADVNAKYQAALEKCPFNHDEVDWLKTTLDIYKEEGRKFGWKKVHFAVWMFYDIYFWPALAIVSPWVISIPLIRALLH